MTFSAVMSARYHPNARPKRTKNNNTDVLRNGNGQWAMGNGQWAMGNGQWAMGNGQWAMGNGQWAMGNGQWAWRNSSFGFMGAPRLVGKVQNDLAILAQLRALAGARRCGPGLLCARPGDR